MTTALKQVVCARCGSTNVGPQTQCLVCQAVLPLPGASVGGPENGGVAPAGATAARQEAPSGVGPAPGRRFCTYCGAPRRPGSRFCTTCGRSFAA